jgi:hypothetical protein
LHAPSGATRPWRPARSHRAKVLNEVDTWFRDHNPRTVSARSREPQSTTATTVWDTAPDNVKSALNEFLNTGSDTVWQFSHSGADKVKFQRSPGQTSSMRCVAADLLGEEWTHTKNAYRCEIEFDVSGGTVYTRCFGGCVKSDHNRFQRVNQSSEVRMQSVVKSVRDAFFSSVLGRGIRKMRVSDVDLEAELRQCVKKYTRLVEASKEKDQKKDGDYGGGEEVDYEYEIAKVNRQIFKHLSEGFAIVGTQLFRFQTNRRNVVISIDERPLSQTQNSNLAWLGEHIKMWKQDPDTHTYQKAVFSFSPLEDKYAFNMFLGIPFEQDYEITDLNYDTTVIQPGKDCIARWANGNKAAEQLLTYNLADLFQNPGERSNLIIVIRGAQGAGKSHVAERLIGQFYGEDEGDLNGGRGASPGLLYQSA